MNNPKIIRTNSNNIDFQELVKELDADLKIRDGEVHAFFAQYNKIDLINHVVVAYMNDEAVGCGAIKQYDDDTMEVKRMFVKPTNRGNGIATMVLKEVENWTKELDFSKCILETEIKQPEAIALYQKNDYTQIPNYGQYETVESSICFEKIL